MIGNEVQVIGVCRWSYPSDSAGFRLAPADLSKARERLYAPSRLEHRLFLLEHVVLPALSQQTDDDFTFILLIGEELPTPYRRRIERLVLPIRQIKCVAVEEGLSQMDVVRELVAEAKDPSRPVSAQFRLDDDDAISVDFVAQLRERYADIRSLYVRHDLFALDFTRGFIMRMSSAEGVSFQPVIARWWAPGTAIFMDQKRSDCFLDFHHLKLWHSMPTLMLGEKPMFIRGVHDSNDSSIVNLGRRTTTFPFRTRDAQRIMLSRFNLKVKTLRAAWDEGFEAQVPA